MISRDFRVDKNTFGLKTSTTIKEKLCILMKCWTVRDLKINDLDGSYTFRKIHKINGMKMLDSKMHSGKFEIIETEDPEEIILRLSF